MKCALFPICLLAATMAAHAQMQEQGLKERLGKWDPTQVSSFQNKNFGGSTFATKNFTANTYGGVKSAPIKAFETRSFLGIKNPWFGKRVFDTYASRVTDRSASEAEKKYQTDAFAVGEYAKAGQKDLVDASVVVPNAAQPRPYLTPPKTPGVMDQFTGNLHKDLTIDDVRELLNKGHTK